MTVSPQQRRHTPASIIRLARFLGFISFLQCTVSPFSAFPRTWVPIGSTIELNPKRPNAVNFQGRNYIVYKPNENDSWVVCDSVCPHRLAPLSEGRITDTGLLECSYHGWSFDATGTCVKIPQATAELQAKVCNSCRIPHYPVQISKNIIWTWPWGDDIVQEDPGERFLQGVADDCNTYTRELPYTYETLVENIVDPSHVPFAHHGLQGTREDAIPINLTISTDVTEAGFAFDFADRTRNRVRKGTGEFRAPYVIQYKALFEQSADDSKNGPADFEVTVICTPSRPGWSRITIFGGNRQPTTKPTSPIGVVFRALPLWAIHMLSSRFLDSDLVFLHYQERTRDPTLAMDGYFMPAPADRCVSAIRKWLKEYSPSEELPPLERDRKRLFDRWSQHSDQCQHCNEVVVVKLPRWRNATYLTLFASLLALPKFFPASIIAISSILLLRFYNMIETMLKEGEFRHYLNE